MVPPPSSAGVDVEYLRAVLPAALQASVGERGTRFEQVEALSGSRLAFGAWDLSLARRVELLVAVGDDVPALRREFQLLARLSHPNIVAVYDYGGVELSSAYVEFQVREALPQGSWRYAESWAQVEGHLPQFLAAMAYLHASGLVYARFRPGCVRTDAYGGLKLAGVMFAREGDLPAPQAPEPRLRDMQFVPPEPGGATPSPAGDVYALGALLVRLVRAIRSLPPTGILELMHRSRAAPDERPQSAAECAATLGCVCPPSERFRLDNSPAQFAGRLDPLAEFLGQTAARARMGLVWLRMGAAESSESLLAVLRRSTANQPDLIRSLQLQTLWQGEPSMASGHRGLFTVDLRGAGSTARRLELDRWLARRGDGTGLVVAFADPSTAPPLVPRHVDLLDVGQTTLTPSDVEAWVAGTSWAGAGEALVRATRGEMTSLRAELLRSEGPETLRSGGSLDGRTTTLQRWGQLDEAGRAALLAVALLGSQAMPERLTALGADPEQLRVLHAAGWVCLRDGGLSLVELSQADTIVLAVSEEERRLRCEAAIELLSGLGTLTPVHQLWLTEMLGATEALAAQLRSETLPMANALRAAQVLSTQGKTLDLRLSGLRLWRRLQPSMALINTAEDGIACADAAAERALCALELGHADLAVEIAMPWCRVVAGGGVAAAPALAASAAFRALRRFGEALRVSKTALDTPSALVELSPDQEWALEGEAGLALMRLGDPERARGYLERASKGAQGARGVEIALGLAEVEAHAGHTDAQLEALRAAAAHGRAAGTPPCVVGLRLLAVVLATGKYAWSKECRDDGLALARMAGDGEAFARLLLVQLRVALALGQFEQVLSTHAHWSDEVDFQATPSDGAMLLVLRAQALRLLERPRLAEKSLEQIPTGEGELDLQTRLALVGERVVQAAGSGALPADLELQVAALASLTLAVEDQARLGQVRLVAAGAEALGAAADALLELRDELAHQPAAQTLVFDMELTLLRYAGNELAGDTRRALVAAAVERGNTFAQGLSPVEVEGFWAHPERSVLRECDAAVERPSAASSPVAPEDAEGTTTACSGPSPLVADLAAAESRLLVASARVSELQGELLSSTQALQLAQDALAERRQYEAQAAKAYDAELVRLKATVEDGANRLSAYDVELVGLRSEAARLRAELAVSQEKREEPVAQERAAAADGRVVFEALPRIRVLEADVERLQCLLAMRIHYPALVFESAAMQQCASTLRSLIGDDLPVVLRGEPGSGRAFWAEQIRRVSARKAAPLIRVRCSELDAVQQEQALFGALGNGHSASGALERARGATLLLSDLDALDPALQSRLGVALRICRQEPAGLRAMPPSVRVLATVRELGAAVDEWVPAPELAEALSGASLPVPPLRQRHADFAPLVQELLASLAAEGEGLPKTTSRALLSRLRQYTFPGNIRELRDVLARAAVESGTEPITARHVLNLG